MISPLWTNETYHLAAIAVGGLSDPSSVVPIMPILLAQNIPNSNDVLLLSIDPVGIRRAEETNAEWNAMLEDFFAVLAELGKHLGIDLHTPSAMLLENPFILPRAR